MKIVQLNAVCGVGSTGGITVEISRMLTAHNIENYILYTNGHHEYELGINYSSVFEVKLGALKSRILGNYGFNSSYATGKLIHMLDGMKPDIVHLHNIHGHDLNLSMFFKYLKKTGVRVIWTMHDCWAFTGYCMHFDAMGCDKWKTQCGSCPQAKRYSWFFDRCGEIYNKKKKLFTSIEDMTIVSPSEWLAKLAGQSFLNKYPIEVINNGIDLEIFRPRESDLRERYHLEGKKIVLGVPKGQFKYFTELGKIIDENYRIVLIGLNEREIKAMPKNITALPRTKDRIEMAEWFSAADVYINTTLEDTFPTVNLESQACGTPVITFNTGGSPEAVSEKTGRTVPKRDIYAMCGAIKELCEGEDRSAACIQRAREKYNAKERFNDYYELYTRSGRFA